MFLKWYSSLKLIESNQVLYGGREMCYLDAKSVFFNLGYFCTYFGISIISLSGNFSKGDSNIHNKSK